MCFTTRRLRTPTSLYMYCSSSASSRLSFSCSRSARACRPLACVAIRFLRSHLHAALRGAEVGELLQRR
jgi:hypothetical protein